MSIKHTIKTLVKTTGSQTSFLKALLKSLEGHFLTNDDKKYIKSILGSAPTDKPLHENTNLIRIIKHAKLNLGKPGLTKSKLIRTISSSKGVSDNILKYQTQQELEKYLNKKDHKYLDSIMFHLSKEIKLSRKQILEVKRILTKADQRKANEDAGVIYFDPRGFSLGSNQHTFYMATTYLVNFGLNIGFGTINGKKPKKTSLNKINSKDLLRFKKKYYNVTNGLEKFIQEFKQHKQRKTNSKAKPFEKYWPAIIRLEEYLTEISPETHIINGLEYATPKGLEMPFPEAYKKTTFQ